MRFLKKKIALANSVKTQENKKISELSINSPQQSQPVLQSDDRSPSCEVNSSPKRKRVPGSYFTAEKSRATKNIVKNYGKAICKFITSRFALPYLHDMIKKEGVKLAGFLAFVKNAKRSIDGLYHFRSILLTNPEDDKKTTSYKKIFRDVSEVFIKFYSVNWIYNSKILHKKAHLFFRFKMLRRIRHPELFTYLKS